MRQENKRTNNTIKWIVATIILITLIIGGSFLGGTFYPNKWTVEKLEDQFHQKELSTINLLGLKEPEFEYTDKATFIEATGKCVEYLNYTTDRLSRVPTSIIIAMAGVESAWGTSRFANEGHALFGVRTWDLANVPHMKAKGNPDAPWGVKKYKTKCDSVLDMIQTINRHSAYEAFRAERKEQLNSGKIDLDKQIDLLARWSTNPDYVKLVKAKSKKVEKILLKHYNGNKLEN